MSQFDKTLLNKVVRGSKRASYDKEAVYNILDSHFLCHVPYVYDSVAITIPTAYGRKGDRVYIHGSNKNRMMLSLLDKEKVSLTVTHMDGLVLARSVFHHSINYRSATIFGTPVLITDDKEKMEALELVTEQIIPGRWDEARIPNEKELNSTLVIGIDITDASAKIREEGANDELADMNLNVWAGGLELETHPTQVVKNVDCKEGLETPESVKNFKFSNHSVQ